VPQFLINALQRWSLLIHDNRLRRPWVPWSQVGPARVAQRPIVMNRDLQDTLGRPRIGTPRCVTFARLPLRAAPGPHRIRSAGSGGRLLVTVRLSVWRAPVSIQRRRWRRTPSRSELALDSGGAHLYGLYG
jgi:hypothetical protein